MGAKCFVDSNVLVYAHDAAAGEKHQRARALVERLWEEGNGVLSTQVLQEFYVNVTRKTARPPETEEVKRWLADYLNWEVVVNDGDAVLEAIDLQLRYQVGFWDALILHAANTALAGIIYSEDLNHGQRYGESVVENPFR